MKALDLTGKRFGRLTALRKAGSDKQGLSWFCKCKCGIEKIVRAADLRHGNVRSCGCLRIELARKRATSHGYSGTKIIMVWAAMIARCENIWNKDYRLYGARGIKVCRRWHKFINFLADMGEAPKGKSIDRYPDNDGDYKPSNCRWATASQQRRNQRPRKRGYHLSYAHRKSIGDALRGRPFSEAHKRAMRRPKSKAVVNGNPAQLKL